VLASTVVWRPLAELKPSAGNPRIHAPKQLHQLLRAIQSFGFTAPLLIDENKTVLAGHARLEAATRLGMAAVPTLQLTGLSPTQRRAYVIADNRLAELAGWDRRSLRREMSDLLDLGFEVELTGFEIAEIDLLIGSAGATSEDLADDDPPAIDAGPAVSRPGDLWDLGPHRLLCGSALEAANYHRLLGADLAQMVFTDPPYNVPIQGHASGLGSVRHREFAMASGEMTAAEFMRFLQVAFTRLCQFSTRASMHFVCMDWRHVQELLSAAQGLYEVRNLCVWNKGRAGMGSLYRSQHELIFVLQNGHGRIINNVQLGATGRYRSNVWDYPGSTALHAGRAEELALHPTVKPVALVADAILDCSRPQGLILDPFAGSGTSLIAAERTGRRARAIELEPRYVDVALRRWQARVGRAPTLHGDGRSFAEIAAERVPAESGAAS
jgi:hypothetical protein